MRLPTSVRRVLGNVAHATGLRRRPAKATDSQTMVWDPWDEIPVEACPLDDTRPLRPILSPLPPTSIDPVWPMIRPKGEADQLNPASQAAYLDRFSPLDQDRCHWYHEVPTADGCAMPGAWALNGNESVYLGGIDVSGRRVFELGPASGHLTWWLEQQGARVVAFDAGLDSTIDLIPYAPAMTDDVRREAIAFITTVQRSWWWTKVEHDLSAEIAYGNIYDLPADLGTFDISVLASVLLHLRDPFGALMSVAERTREAIVVTDLEPPRPWSDTEMRFNPIEGDHSSWWLISPGATQRMLSNVGFTDQTVTRHVQWHRYSHEMGAQPRPMSFYTVVARRP